MIGSSNQPHPRDLMDRLHRAREAGVGVYLREWVSSHGEGDSSDGATHPLSPEALAAAVMAWCRDTLGATRRPWGIAHFDLALSTAGGGDAVAEAPRSLSLRRLAPSDLYPGDSFLAEVQRYLAQRDPIAHLAVALFSWGDAAHEAFVVA